MLGFLQRWRSERGREIFRYWDGRRNRRADPMALYRALETHPEFNWDEHPSVLFSLEDIDPDTPPALLKTMTADWMATVGITSKAVRQIFGVPEFADGGLTEAECVGLLCEFVGYNNALKKNANPGLMPLPFTESASSPILTMQRASDSGSTPPAPQIESP